MVAFGDIRSMGMTFGSFSDDTYEIMVIRGNGINI
jgi:hypothetical protein